MNIFQPHERQPLPQWVEGALGAPGPEWLIEDLIPACGLTVIAGRPKLSKKSWLAMLTSMMMASGRAAAGLRVPQAVPVLYLSLEGTPHATAERFRMLESGHTIKLADCHQMYFSLNAPFALDKGEYMDELVAFILDKGIKCLVIDTFARAFYGDENSAQDVGRAMRACARITGLGCAVILVHHLRKESGTKNVADMFIDPDSGMRGSSALSGALDILVSIKCVPRDGHYETYAVVGGKTKDYVVRRIDWRIAEPAARLNLGREENLEDVCRTLQEPDAKKPGLKIAAH